MKSKATNTVNKMLQKHNEGQSHIKVSKFKGKYNFVKSNQPEAYVMHPIENFSFHTPRLPSKDTGLVPTDGRDKAKAAISHNVSEDHAVDEPRFVSFKRVGKQSSKSKSLNEDSSVNDKSEQNDEQQNQIKLGKFSDAEESDPQPWSNILKNEPKEDNPMQNDQNSCNFV